MSKRKTNDEFIAEAVSIHGHKFSYELTQYKTASEKVIIECPKHGPFTINPGNFLKGRGCPSCAKNKKMTTAQWVARAQEKYGNAFDYSKVEYVNARVPVEISHPDHGTFFMVPKNHMHGLGYPIRKRK